MKFINRLAYIRIILIYSFIVILFSVAPSHAADQEKLKVGFSIYSPPVFFIEYYYGTLIRGLSVDIAKLVVVNMNGDIQFYAMPDSRLIEELNKGNLDLVFVIKDNQYNLENMDVIETNIKIDRKFFINRECTSFTSLKDVTGHTLAVEKGHFLSRLPFLQPDVKYIETENQDEALATLDSGKAQVYISHSSLLTLDAIKKKGFFNIKEAGTSIESLPMIIATQKKDHALHASLNEAYKKASKSKDYNDILKRWLDRDIKYDVWVKKDIRYFFSNYAKHLTTVIGLVILALFTFISWNTMLKRKVLQVTKNLRMSEQRYRDLIELSPDMIHLISMHGEIRLANKIALTHLGYNENEITSLRLHDLVLPEQMEDVTVFIVSVFRDRYSHKEFTFKAKDGNSIQVEMVATIMTELDPVEDLACCFSRDVTERKRLEENLLHSDRLAIMGRMAAGIAHEINNPLGIILTNTQDALYHKLSDEDSVEGLKSIERSAIRAAKIIEDMLNFTRPVPLQLSPIDLPLLIDGSLLLLKHKLKQKNIKIEKKYPVNMISFNGDENLIQQLLINIILNSIHAIKNEGLIKILINLTGENGDRKIILEIEDNGIGIPEEDLQKIFNPFFTSRKENGFGMGLFISKIIVDKHHGSLSVRSKVGIGTTMSLEFPVEAINS